jgi:hypothetical protein
MKKSASIIAFSMFTILLMSLTITPIKASQQPTPSLSSPTDTVFASWVESNEKILSKRSIDGGSTFGNNIDFSQEADCCSMPAAASFQNNVYVVWSNFDDSSSQDDVLFRKSTDGGATFGDTVNLSNTPNRSFQAAIAVSGNEVYVVWSDGTPDNHDILLKKSTNGGASFGSIINLSDELGGYSEQASVAVNGNIVYIVWRETTGTPFSDEIFYRRSADGGITFSDSVNLSNTAGISAVPVVATSGNNVYVAWTDSDSLPVSSVDTLLRRSTDGGVTFNDAVNLSAPGRGGGEISIGVSGNNVYIAWADFSISDIDIQYRRSTDNGATFEDAVNLSNNEGESYYPKIATLNNNVYIVWNDNSNGNFEVLYRKSIDNGVTFESIVNLSNTVENSQTPAITATIVNTVPSDTSPPNTSITSAVDGNNAVLSLANPSASATVSKKVTITFTGTDNVGIAGFQCSLDGKPFVSCTSPITSNNLAFGTHTFKVKAIDTAGNADPTPASFTWIVLTSAQGIEKLKSFVTGMQDVSSNSKASFNARLDGALKYLTDSSTANDRGSCSQLDGFIRTANAYARVGNISTQQANQIIQTLPYSAQAIKASLGCA